MRECVLCVCVCVCDCECVCVICSVLPSYRRKNKNLKQKNNEPKQIVCVTLLAKQYMLLFS